jgi:hypothetical protein
VVFAVDSDVVAVKEVVAVEKVVEEDEEAVVDVAEDVDVEDLAAVERTKKNGFQSRNSVVWSRKERSKSWRKFICTLCRSKSSKLSTFSWPRR